MKVNRKDLEWFIKRIKLDDKENKLTEAEFAEKLARHIEANPGCIKTEETSYYSPENPLKIGDTVYHEDHGKGKVKTVGKDEVEVEFFWELNTETLPVSELKHVPRFSFSTVGYGVFSLLGERYRMGRIEIFDARDTSGYQSDEGIYCMPFLAANQFESFIESLVTDYPIHIEIGNHTQCDHAVSEELGIPVDKLNDAETKKEFYRKKNEEYAQKTYGISWDEHVEAVMERMRNRKQ